MKIVVSNMHPETREAILEEVEFDGTIKGLCGLLNLTKYTEEYGYEGNNYQETSLNINVTHTCMFHEDEDPWNFCKINNIYCGESKIAFIGLSNIIGGKPLLTKEYLEKKIMYRTEDNPDLLTKEELLLEKEQWD